MNTRRCLFGEQPNVGEPPRECSPRWRERLSPSWQALVVAPQWFRIYREYEMPARQLFGHDDRGRTCFYAFDYRLIEPRLDDDAGLCSALVYAESLRAWLLRDGDWLVNYRQWPEGDDGEMVETLTQTPDMPRQGLGQR